MANNGYSDIVHEPKLSLANNPKLTITIFDAFERMKAENTGLHTIHGRMILLEELEKNGFGMGTRSKKTSTITLDNIKDEGWADLGHSLGMSNEEIRNTFQYSEYGAVKLVVDENLNIVGGRIIPKSK